MIKYFAALISIILGSVAQYLFKIGVSVISSKTNDISEILKLGIINVPIWSGLVCYGVSLILWFYVLSQLELSKAYPLVSLGYVFTLFLGYFFLNEAITVSKIGGIAFIVLGVFVLTR